MSEAGALAYWFDIAPEVVAGKKQPSIETDLHALAVLIYETLLLRHPLAGPKVRSTRSPVG